MPYVPALQACHGDQHVLPKHHLAMHLAMQLQRHGALWTCFVHERRHKILKRPGEHVNKILCLMSRDV